MANAKPFWRDVWAQVTATLIGAAILALVAAWRWSDVKPYLSGTWGWLSGNANITRGGLLALVLALVVLLLVCAVALAVAAVSQTAKKPEKGHSVDLSAVAKSLTAIQRSALSILFHRWPGRVRLDTLHELICDEGIETSRAHVAREIEILELTGAVEQNRSRYYWMTDWGRDWLLDTDKAARATQTPSS